MAFPFSGLRLGFVVLGDRFWVQHVKSGNEFGCFNIVSVLPVGVCVSFLCDPVLKFPSEYPAICDVLYFPLGFSSVVLRVELNRAWFWWDLAVDIVPFPRK